MFVSLPQYRFPMPRGLGSSEAMYWRALSTSSFSAWYVMNVTLEEADGPECRTFLFWWDSDVLEAIDQLAPLSIDSLVCMFSPTHPNAEPSVAERACIAIKEIWQADTGEDSLGALFIDVHGCERAGHFADLVDKPARRQRLVGRVGEPVRASNTATAGQP